MPIQLPDDALPVGYKKSRSFEFEQIFRSATHNFTGTEKEFVNAGLAYEYIQLTPFKRLDLTTKG